MSTSIFFRIFWGNDGMNYLLPATQPLSRGRTFYDDDGFTNDEGFQLSAFRPNTEFHFFGQHRMITERNGLRRVDEVDGEFAVQRKLGESGRTQFWGLAGLGFVATGPLGGAGLQDRFHRLIRWGRTLNGELEGQLQNTYEGSVRVSPRLRVGAEARVALGAQTHGSARAEISLAHDVGTSGAGATFSLQHRWKVAASALEISMELAVWHRRANEERLTFPGGYPDQKTFVTPNLGIKYLPNAFELGFALQMNVEGTGAHQGVLSFGYRIR